ncbi:hypothetical protein C8R44DRAFT_871470 [Mycena epipterygia]|nr:hypothetical protein C8R44DRAFT_871470 [Mycena epipterygia]
MRPPYPSGGLTNITWTSTSYIPIFSIELTHPSFNAGFAIANNGNPTANNLMLTIPSVPPARATPSTSLSALNLARAQPDFERERQHCVEQRWKQKE